ncbi:hypothetical protein WDW37_01325 [Bdellovibrionota bacterium FG-1]
MGNQRPPLSSITPPSIRRFRTNPVEVVIFSVISLIFFNSLYQLFYEQGFNPAVLSPMAASPTSESGRAPASLLPSLANIELRCDAPPTHDADRVDEDVVAPKMKLAGSLCGKGSNTDPSKLIRASVVNKSNTFNATVFTNAKDGKFSTDYIPLNSGHNFIHVEFSYHGGETVTRDLTINKN